jgi:pSer/pThr/pTyr-binding forkhead associated (FHA) protein
MSENTKTKPKGVSISFTALAEDDGEGVRYQVNEFPAIIGKNDGCEINIDGVGVAGTHAQLTWSDNSLFIEDMGTGGVTMVNTSMIKKAKLRNGDLVEVGEGKLLVQIGTVTKEETEESSKLSTKSAEEKNIKVWIAGFNSEFREWVNIHLIKEFKGVHAYRTGEDILVDVSKSILKGRPPEAIIFDLRVPIINGINAAISVRAYEQGYKAEKKIPIVFLFDPPGKSSFDKVAHFCRPVKVISPGNTPEETKAALKDYIVSLG